MIILVLLVIIITTVTLVVQKRHKLASREVICGVALSSQQGKQTVKKSIYGAPIKAAFEVTFLLVVN